MGRRAVHVYLEIGGRRVFACAVEWAGWCRAGATEPAALDALAAYAPRYAVALGASDIRFPAQAPRFEVVARLEGNATTDFGAPGQVPDLDRRRLPAAGARRLAGQLQAAWRSLDEAAAGAPPTIRKGPRGGGRDRDAILAHVAGAEVAYARKIGIRRRPPDVEKPGGLDEMRREVLDLVRASRGQATDEGEWPVRYAVRRIAWHALDHAWEIEDRAEEPG